jgi:hypothetical protein
MLAGHVASAGGLILAAVVNKQPDNLFKTVVLEGIFLQLLAPAADDGECTAGDMGCTAGETWGVLLVLLIVLLAMLDSPLVPHLTVKVWACRRAD